jgi:hypothetical protein
MPVKIVSCQLTVPSEVNDSLVSFGSLIHFMLVPICCLRPGHCSLLLSYCRKERQPDVGLSSGILVKYGNSATFINLKQSRTHTTSKYAVTSQNLIHSTISLRWTNTITCNFEVSSWALQESEPRLLFSFRMHSNIFSKSDTWTCGSVLSGAKESVFSVLIKKRKYIWTSYAVRLRADMLFLALTTAVWLVTSLRSVSLECKGCCWTVFVRFSRLQIFKAGKAVHVSLVVMREYRYPFPAVITPFLLNRLRMETVVLFCFCNCSHCNIVAYMGIQFYVILVRNTKLRYFIYWAMKGLSTILQFRCSFCCYSWNFAIS